MAFSPDGQWLATAGSRDKTVWLWDGSTLFDTGVTDTTAEPTELTVLRGHEGPVYSVTFSPDGRWLATGDYAGAARLWRLRPDELLDLACRVAGRNLTHAEWQLYFVNEPYRETALKNTTFFAQDLLSVWASSLVLSPTGRDSRLTSPNIWALVQSSASLMVQALHVTGEGFFALHWRLVLP